VFATKCRVVDYPRRLPASASDYLATTMNNRQCFDPRRLPSGDSGHLAVSPRNLNDSPASGEDHLR
jgi:hypothetical protein